MDKEILEQLEITAKYNLSFAVNAGYATQLYNYINNLQQRIDKAIDYIKGFDYKEQMDEDTTINVIDEDMEKLLSILQGEEVKDNE